MAERSPWRATGRVLVAGRRTGVALVLDEPLSFWGGVDAASGRIIDGRHAQRGEVICGRVLAMPAGRGSSSSSSVLAEALRNRTGPAAIVLARTDEIVALGALVAQLLDGIDCPVVRLQAADYARLATGDRVLVGEDGEIAVE
jgi:uncharacterized protein